MENLNEVEAKFIGKITEKEYEELRNAVRDHVEHEFFIIGLKEVRNNIDRSTEYLSANMDKLSHEEIQDTLRLIHEEAKELARIVRY